MGHSEKMEQEDNRPKWLLELENRKRKVRQLKQIFIHSRNYPNYNLKYLQIIVVNEIIIIIIIIIIIETMTLGFLS